MAWQVLKLLLGSETRCRRLVALPLSSFVSTCWHMMRVLNACAGVDGSERIAKVAERLVQANGLSQAQGGPVTILQGRLEQLSSLAVDKVALFLHSPACVHSCILAGRGGLHVGYHQLKCSPPDVAQYSCLQQLVTTDVRKMQASAFPGLHSSASKSTAYMMLVHVCCGGQQVPTKWAPLLVLAHLCSAQLVDIMIC